MPTRLAKIIFRVILKSAFLSTSRVKCSVWCNSFVSVRIKEKKREQPLSQQFWPHLVVHCARRSDPESLRSRSWDISSSVVMTPIIRKRYEQQLREGAGFTSLHISVMQNLY